MVSGTTLPDGDPFLQRQNEPSGGVSTRNPLHLLAGANDYRTVDIPGLPDGAEVGDAWLGVFKSNDGGQTWRSTLIPGYPQDQSAAGLASPLKGYQAAADPTVRPGTNGLFYYSGIAFDRGANGKSAVFVSRFIDNNNTAGGDPIAYLGTTVVDNGNKAKFLDKPYIAVDIPRPGGPSCTIQSPGTTAAQTIPAGAVYLAYQVFSGTDAAPTSRLMFSSSLDCGATWSKPSKVKDLPKTNQGVQIAIAPATGEVYLTWRAFADPKLGGDAILFSKSDDLKKLKFKDSIVFPMKPFDQGTSNTSFRTNSYPTIAVDGTGRIYLTWTERGWGPPGGPSAANPTLDPRDARVVMTTSKDGVTWTTRQPIENNSTHGHQIMPVVTAIGGKISVVYYDLREDVSKVFNVYVDENDVTTKRHTLDLRILQADPGDIPTFAPSVQVSEYMWGILPDEGPGKFEQLQFNVPNLPLFAQGTSPFMGDFIDLAGEMFAKDAAGNWIFNTNGSRTVHAFWTDNRDVRPPKDNNWKNYTPPTSDYTDQVCTPGQTGMRNSNIYTARITPGLRVGAPTNTKRLLSETGPADRRSFVVFAQNNTNETRKYRFTITNQPPGGTASFLQFSPLSDPLKVLETAVAPRSTSSRTVYVSSSDPTASVKVDIVEIPGEPGSAPSLGLTGSVTLNPDKTNPTVTNPTVTNTEVFNPTVTNPTVTNPTVTNPTVTNPTVTNPTVTNPTVTNPTVTNVVLANPTVTNPTVTNPTVTNPTVTNSDMVNPTVTNTELLNGSLTDTTWTVKNEGNTAGSFAVKTLLTKPAPPGFKTQLLVYKTYTTPVTLPNDCAIKTESQMVLVASIPNPTVTNPTVTNPTVTNGDVTNPTVTNASLWLDVGEEAKVTFRVLNPDRTQTVAETVTRPNGQQETVFVAPAFNAEQVVAPAVVPTSVNTTDAAAGITTPVVVAPLIITTTALSDALFNAAYSAQLTSVGGVPGPHIWSLSGGTLPNGLQLSAAGVITGTPTAAGLFSFEVQATDTATPTTHVAHADLFIRVAPLGTAQVLTTLEDQALPISLSAAGFNNAAIIFVAPDPLHGTLSGTAPNLTYTPAANYNGPDSFAFTATVMTSKGPVTSPPTTVSLTVTAVNDVPSFTRGADQTVLEDSGTRTVAGWATGISAGPPDEQLVQAVSFTTSNSNNALFTAQPVVTSDGTLTFTPAPNANGTAIVTVTIGDNGLAANGGVDTSAAQTFTITVTSVNDAPSFTTGGDQTVPEDTGPQTIPAWATSISAGPADEGGQTLSFATSNTNPGLFSAQPAIAPNGTLTYAPAPDARGTATVTVTLTDSGLTLDGGVDTSTAQTFVISVVFTGPMVVTTTALPGAPRSAPYSQTLAADGTTGVRTWSITGGFLPPWISLNSATGTLSGTAPATCGTANFTVTVTDSATPVPQTASRSLSLSVTGSLFMVSTGLPTAVTFENYTPSVFASCGNGSPRTWSISGALPLGVGFNTNTGQFTATNPVGVNVGPRQNGTFPLTIQVFDSAESDTKNLTLKVLAVDQQVFTSGLGSSTTIGGTTRIAQTVTVAATGTLTGVRFQSLSPAPPATSCPVMLTIEGVNPANGAPDDNQIFASASATITGTNQIFGLPGLFFGVDTRLAIVLSSTGSCQVTSAAVTDNYPGGAAFVSTGGAWAQPSGPGAIADVPLNTLIQNPSLSYLTKPRFQVRSVTLNTGPNTGKVLIIGTDGTAELFEPSTGVSTLTSNAMQTTRFDASVTLLADGRVLILGGSRLVPPSTTSEYQATGEIFDPTAGTFTPLTATLQQGRALHSATLLTCPAANPSCWWKDNVLITGGVAIVPPGLFSTSLQSAEVFNPLSGTFSPTAQMSSPRSQHAAARLPDGRVLVAGGFGFGSSQPSAEIFDGAAGAGSFYAAGEMVTRRARATATLLNNGTVLVAGGLTTSGPASMTPGAEIYTPASAPAAGTFAGTASMLEPRLQHTATLLGDGSVLFAGGQRYTTFTGSPWAAAERYVPATGFVGAPAMNVTRTDHGAAILPNGRIVIAGGSSNNGRQAPLTSEVYDPGILANGAPSSTPSIANPNLPDGHVGSAYVDAVGAAVALNGVGGTATPYTFAVIAPSSLPSGITLSPGGVFGGSPAFPGTYYFDVLISDAAANSSHQTLRIRVDALDITTTSLPSAYVGRAYSQTLNATGIGAKTWSLTFGSLPAGLTLTANGTISGTPTILTGTSFTVRAVDSAGQSATASLFIAVNNPLDITTTSLHEGVVLDTFYGCLGTSGGVGNRAFTISAGALPQGVFLSGNGCFSGAPSRPGSYSFTVEVTDESNPAQSDTQPLSIHVSVQDQATGGDLNPAITFGLTGPRILAQTMRAGVTGSLSAVNLWNLTCPANTQLTVQVESVTPTGSVPSGTILGSGTGRWSDPVVIAVPPLVVAGQRVALVFSVDSDCTIINPATLDYYARGEGFLRVGNGAWQKLIDVEGRTDLAFRSLMVPAADFYYLTARRTAHTSTVLASGKILTTGGYSGATAELFDPATGLVTPAGSMSVVRTAHTATLLDSGKVLIVGGFDYGTSTYLATAEVYDPAAGTFTPTTTSLASGRYIHAAARLADGRVLIAGGYGSSGADSTAEIYDPATNDFAAIGNMTRSRYDFTATLLDNNKVLLFGGNSGGPYPVANAELYDPASNTFTAVPGPYTPLRAYHTATTLADGRVAIIGGVFWPNMAAGAQIYDWATNAVTASGSLLTARRHHTATLMADGAVLVIGGGASIDWSENHLASVERFDPATGTFSAAGSIGVDRWNHRAVGVGTTVLVIGGQSSTDVSALSAELFDPAATVFMTPATLPDGSSTPPGNSYSATIAAAGGTGPWTLTLVSGSLPPGLSFDGGTGLISGTPTTTGNFVFGIRAADSAGHAAVQTFQIRIDAHDITTTTLPDGHPGAAYSYSLAASGQAPITWTMVTWGALPPGLSLSSGGLLTGAAAQQGKFTFKVQATDFTGRTATKILWLDVTPSLQVTTTSLDDAAAPWSYGGCLSWSGGSGTVSFTTPSGGLPYGLTLTGNGCFTGAPRQTGRFTFTAQATDQSVPAQSVSRTLTLRVGTADQAEHAIDPQTAPPATTFGDGTELAQVFTPRMNGYLLHFRTPVACSSGGVHVEIQGVTAGQPNGTVLGSADIAATSVGSFQGAPYFRQLPFDAPVFLTSGVPVAAVLRTAGTCAVTGAPPSTSTQNYTYPDGDGFIGSTGGWTPLSTSDATRPDLPFQAIVDDGGRLEFLISGRDKHAATLLTTGDYAGLVLLTGGYGQSNTTEFFNPTASEIGGVPPGRFAAGPPMSVGRIHHTATAMTDGSVIVVGGFDSNGTALASAERFYFNTVTNAWTWTGIGSMSTPRFAHTATLLSNGRLLIVGGYAVDWSSARLATTDLLSNDGSYLFVSGPSLTSGRAEHAAVKLNDGRVLVTGGWGVGAASAGEVYDPVPNAFTTAGPMQFARAKHAAALLGSGKVLIVGGSTQSGSASVATPELFDPANDSFAAIPANEPREGARAVVLNDGKVLIAGGTDHAGAVLASTAVYDPATQAFAAGGDLVVGRVGFTATSVTGNRVLIAGGCCGSSAQHVSGEIFDPAAQTIPPSIVNSPFSTTIAGPGGTNTFVIKSGTLPDGLTLNSSTGAITGTPTVAGVFHLVIEITDAAGRTTLREVTIQINGPLAISTTTLPDAVLGSPYSVALAANGGGGTRSWSHVGSLVPGLTLSTDGVIAGTPTVAGSYTLTVDVIDTQGGADSRQLTLVVDPPWTTTFPDGGVVLPSGLVIDPNNQSNVYAVLNWRGIHKSADSANSWTSITDAAVNPWPFDRTSVSFFTVLPGSNTFYAISGGRPFKSTNQGLSWVDLSTGFPGGNLPGYSLTLAVDPNTTRLWISTSPGGLYQSSDGGASWQPANNGLPFGEAVWSLAIDPTNPDVVYAGTGTNGVYKTTTPGPPLWTPINGYVSTDVPLQHIFALAVNPVAPGIVYAAGRESSGTSGIARSVSGGFGWSRLSGSPTLYWQPGQNLIALSATTDTVFAGSYGNVYRWTAGGTPFVSNQIGNTQVTSVALDQMGGVYAGTNGLGLFRAPAFDMAAWVPKSAGLRGINFPHSFAHSVHVDQSNPSFVYAGSINGGYRSVTGGASWLPMSLPNGSASTLLTHPLEPGAVYSFQNDLFKSTDNGQTWQDLTGARGSWNDGDFAIDPNNRQRIYLAATGSWQSDSPGGIYKTTDGGATWQFMTSGLPSLVVFHTIAVHPQDGNVVFAATQGGGRFTNVPEPQQGIYRTYDGGISWHQLQGGLPTPLYVNQIVIHPLSPNIMYAGAEMTNGGVYKSTDGGDTWTFVLTENVNTVVVDPTSTSRVYAGTWNTKGFYRSRDGGATWTTFNAGLPIEAGIESIGVDPFDPRHLFLGTTAGSYEINFTGPPPPVDLAISMVDSPDPATLGNSLVYTIQVSNVGLTTALGVAVNDPLPGYVSFLSAVSTQGSCTSSGGTVSCSLGALAPAQTATITLNTVPGASGQFTNTATVSAAQTDLVPANNTATATTTAQAASATSTSTVGGGGGTPFSMSCPAGHIVTALKGQAGDDMDRTELWCSSLTPNGYGTAFLQDARGGFGGDAYSYTCVAGKRLTGLHGRAGTVLWGGFVVDTLGATCTNPLTGATDQSPAFGNAAPAATPFTLNCPAGQAVVGFNGGQGGLLDRIGLICR